MSVEDDELEDDDEEPAAPEPANPDDWPGMAPKQAAVLSALVFFAGNRSRAAKAANIARSLFYRWAETDPAFRIQLTRAELQAWYTVQDAMIDRSVTGVARWKYYEGVRIPKSKEMHYSDSLALAIARANDVRYRAAEVKVSGDLGLKFQGELVDLLQLHRKLTKPTESEE